MIKGSTKIYSGARVQPCPLFYHLPTASYRKLAKHFPDSLCFFYAFYALLSMLCFIPFIHNVGQDGCKSSRRRWEFGISSFAIVSVRGFQCSLPLPMQDAKQSLTQDSESLLLYIGNSWCSISNFNCFCVKGTGVGGVNQFCIQR